MNLKLTMAFEGNPCFEYLNATRPSTYIALESCVLTAKIRLIGSLLKIKEWIMNYIAMHKFDLNSDLRSSHNPFKIKILQL